MKKTLPFVCFYSIFVAATSCKTTSGSSLEANPSSSQNAFTTCISPAPASKGNFTELTLVRETLNVSDKTWKFLLSGRSPIDSATPYPKVGTFNGEFKVDEIRISNDDYDLPSRLILNGSGKILLQGKVELPIKRISVSQGDASATILFDKSETIAKAPNNEWAAYPCKFNAKQYKDLESQLSYKN